ncbi:DUF397 domain-containing protein [Streptomyces sp. H10-C2]|uniref:DUF397 domain-containing protein n=1 Tax=unclassified Streptomyces TaxID=2593676 RepID=UPI0024B9E016|nr:MULTISPECIES: DUF397 domain-containing protein [unclassified Streptomyces]MDJ0340379.1 DUF397 domain-containing protein [Streptomyces sp. PH10-H1]MDJ0368173.1 DUF397 domain-containing protein [Streptomyces sp. H10-C2]
MSQLVWQKSSFSSGGQGECVEVATGSAGLVHLRESDDPVVIVTTTPAALRALLRATKAGAFDRLGR